jgi:DNA-binding response OmpR family regulator
MHRPTFLVAEPEPDQALSSRKLLLENFKFNVITAHSEQEMLELLNLFPNVNAVILHDDTPGQTAAGIVKTVKDKAPKMQVVALNPRGSRQNHLADHVVNSHNPEELLHLLQNLFGDPRRIDGKGTPLPGDTQ